MSQAHPASTAGIHHLGLTVPNLAAARAFFSAGLGFEQVGEKPAYPAVFLSDGQVMVTLWQADDPATARAFDRRRNVGLHHLALRIDGSGRLDELHERLAQRDDVVIEFAPEPLNGGPTRHMMCSVPGDIRIEFIAPGAA